MNGQTILTAMLPEHLLLAGIVLLIAPEIVGSRRGALVLSVLFVAAAAVAAWMLHASGYAASPFAGHFSAGPVPFLSKAVVLARGE